MPTGADWDAYRRLCNQNATCFHALEQAHPINFFEQRDVCTHCGCERLVTMNSKHCCQHGSLLMERDFPEELLRLISIAPGLSKQSRAANDLFRFAQMALPKGTHRIPDSYQHLKVTGIPFAVLSNLNERSSTRAFLDDPSERLDASDRYCAQVRPSEAAIETIRTVMESTNCLVRQLINWSEASHQTARLVLKWPGTTQAVRAFTVDPSASVKQPRSVFFTRRDEDERCYVKTESPGYAPLMWPLAFPYGQPPTVCKGDGTFAHLDAEGTLRHATLALMHQPERWAPDEYVYVPTKSPYDPTLPPIYRRFSRLELMGRLGDEILVDRWLTVVDARLRTISQEWMQKRLLGQLGGDGENELETEADVAEAARGSYLPASEIGTPRHMRSNCSDAMACLRQLGCEYLLFITVTTDISPDWPEIQTGLAHGACSHFVCMQHAPLMHHFDPGARPQSLETPIVAYFGWLPACTEGTQDPFDRAALHAEVFNAKVEAFLARLRTGSIFRNLGRPTVREVQYEDADGQVRTMREYTYPMQTAGGGFLICAVEDQDRGLGHIHIAYKPATAPRESWNPKPRPKEAMPWVDELVCARIPDEEMLATFKMVVPAGEARAMLGVSKQDGTAHAKYAYLNDASLADDSEVLHPDIVANFGYGLHDDGTYCHEDGKRALLKRLVTLVSGTPRGGTPDAPDHWSLHPYHHPGKGKLIHKHHNGPCVPDAHCKPKGRSECKDRYPKPEATYTHWTEDGYINYRRGPADIMVVPYNPWIMLHFTSHINVEFVCSATNVVLYLFKLMKYILKGGDVNRLQLVANGQTQRGDQGSADGSTHRRATRALAHAWWLCVPWDAA